jgi:hypothetical protein
MRMTSFSRRVGGLVVIAVGVLALPAVADSIPITTFGFTDLAGSYDANTGIYMAMADVITDGDVTRLIPSSQVALFEHDFTGAVANFDLELQITGVTATTANAAGQFVITDANGDMIQGNLGGAWVRSAPFAILGAQISHVTLVSLSGDGMFNGPNGGSFSLDYSQFDPQALTGALTALVTNGWFDTSWSAKNTLAQASILPEPHSLYAIPVALFLLWRRR